MQGQEAQKHLQYLLQESQRVSTPYFRRLSQNQACKNYKSTQNNFNKVKIKFVNRQSKREKQKQQKQDREKLSQLFEYNQKIDPWNSSGYSKQQEFKQSFRNKQSQGKNSKKTFNFQYINKGIVTTKSWHAQRQRLKNLKRALPIFKPITTNISEQKDILCFLRRRDQQSQQMRMHKQSQQSNLLDKTEFSGQNESKTPNSMFDRHKKLLSRIYSHSCQPKIIIKQISQRYKQHLPDKIQSPIISINQYNVKTPSSHKSRVYKHKDKDQYKSKINSHRETISRQIAQVKGQSFHFWNQIKRQKPKEVRNIIRKVTSHQFKSFSAEKTKKRFLQIV